MVMSMIPLSISLKSLMSRKAICPNCNGLLLENGQKLALLNFLEEKVRAQKKMYACSVTVGVTLECRKCKQEAGVRIHFNPSTIVLYKESIPRKIKDSKSFFINDSKNFCRL